MCLESNGENAYMVGFHGCRESLKTDEWENVLLKNLNQSTILGEKSTKTLLGAGFSQFFSVGQSHPETYMSFGLAGLPTVGSLL